MARYSQIQNLSMTMNYPMQSIKLRVTMQEMSTLRIMEKERLKTLVESMGSGLLMFGREGSVNLVNGVFRKTFGFTNDEIIGKTFNDNRIAN